MYLENWDLYQYLYLQVHRGVRGVVRNSGGEAVEGAVITVEQVAATPATSLLQDSGLLGKNVTTSSRGEFWRLLLPGTYTIRAEFAACETAGITLASAPMQVRGEGEGDPAQVTLTEERQVVERSLVLDQLAACSEGPR